MSLVPKDSLKKILRVVAQEQVLSADRLSLAIPISEVFSYYEAELLSDTLAIKKGLLMTLSIPLASRQTAVTVYKADAIPMLEPESALKLKIEAEYLAVSEDQMETAAISQGQLDKCIGSSKYQIFHENTAREIEPSSCLANLFFKGTLDALKVCDTEKMFLPMKEHAKSLGFGVWLITSAHDGYSSMETSTLSSSDSTMRKFKGCRICLISLECGRQIMGPNIKIRSELSSCEHIPAVKVNVKLPGPLAHLIGTLSSVEKMPTYNQQVDASMDTLRNVREKLTRIATTANNEALEDIAKPIAT